MKLFKLTYGLMAAAALTIASCDINKLPTFDDADAFVAFQVSSASIAEDGGTLEIPVMLTSLSGISGSVDFEIVSDSLGAKEGTHFDIVNSSKTLSFTKDSTTQKIVLNVIDNDTFGGDVKCTIKLTNSKGVNIGASKSCLVTIEDNEHPLAFILGAYAGKGTSQFYDEEEWAAKTEKDASDLTKIWITGLVPDTSNPIYGTVNAEHTEISIPVGQLIHPHSTYDITFEAYHCENGERGDGLNTGESVIGKIAADGTLSFPDYWLGGYATNKSTGAGAGWWDLMHDDVVLKKQ